MMRNSYCVVLVFCGAYTMHVSGFSADLKRLKPVGWTDEALYKRSIEVYTTMYKKLLPKFKDYTVNQIPIRLIYNGVYETAHILRNERLNPKYWDFVLCNETPKTRCTVKGYSLRDTVDTLWHIENCNLIMPRFKDPYIRHAPQNKDEARFLLCKVLAHSARATEVRCRIELDPTHYPKLNKNLRYHWHIYHTTSFYKLYKIMKPGGTQEHEMAAIHLALKVGGRRAWRGGIRYTSRQLITAYFRQTRLSRNSSSYRTRAHKYATAITQHSHFLRAILRWVFYQEGNKPEVFNCFYRAVLRTIPQFDRLSPQHQQDMVKLSDMTS